MACQGRGVEGGGPLGGSAWWFDPEASAADVLEARHRFTSGRATTASDERGYLTLTEICHSRVQGLRGPGGPLGFCERRPPLEGCPQRPRAWHQRALVRHCGAPAPPPRCEEVGLWNGTARAELPRVRPNSYAATPYRWHHLVSPEPTCWLYR